MVRNKILIILTLAVSSYIFSIEPTFIVTEDSPVWKIAESFKKKKNVEAYLSMGDLVIGITSAWKDDIDKKDSFFTSIIFNKIKYQIQTEYLLPANTESYFDKDLLVDINDPDKKVWVITYYLDIFSSQNRRLLYKYEQEWLKDVEEWNAQEEYGSSNWWDELVYFDNLRFFNTSIMIGKLARDDFFVINIKEISNGYKVTVQGDKDYKEKILKRTMNDNMLFPLYKDQETFDLIFQFDGDYCDVYVDSIDNFFSTFALVEPVFLDEFEDLIHEGMCNYKRVQEWPKRADGSMDFPPVDPSKIGP